jgi:hypothetical protein
MGGLAATPHHLLALRCKPIGVPPYTSFIERMLDRNGFAIKAVAHRGGEEIFW